MFSATFPKQVKNLVDEYLKDYIHIAIGNQGKLGSINTCITQELVDIRNHNKNSILFDLISKIEGKLLGKFLKFLKFQQNIYIRSNSMVTSLSIAISLFQSY